MLISNNHNSHKYEKINEKKCHQADHSTEANSAPVLYTSGLYDKGKWFDISTHKHQQKRTDMAQNITKDDLPTGVDDICKNPPFIYDSAKGLKTPPGLYSM